MTLLARASRDFGLLFPWCRHDVTGIAPDDGTPTSPECGRTCTMIEAHGAARAAAMRPGAFTREALVGGSVVRALARLGAFVAWKTGIRTPGVWAVALVVWLASFGVGVAGWTVALYHRRERTGKLWPVAAGAR